MYVVGIDETENRSTTYPPATKYQCVSEIVVVHPDFGTVLSPNIPIRIEYFRLVRYLWVMEDGPYQGS